MLRIQRAYLPVKSLRCALSFQKAYRIEESDTRGKIVVAARDVKKGELILEDNEPILHFPEPVNSGTSKGIHVVVAAFSAFMKQLTPEKQRKYLTLYGPTTGLPAETIRNVAKNDFQYRFNREEGHRNLTPDEVETFVKVAQITRLNIFGSDADGNSVFEEMTRFAHSCGSNCTYMLRDKSIVCYATRSIKAGEELTISYFVDRDMKPIHERRLKYLEAKEFTCHCPRCSAPGDDTRQFDCVDPACNGVMMARQPLSKELARFSGLPYTGVEYEEPHLLPCTVCRRTAPADYQTKMFSVEALLPVVADVVSQRFDALLREHFLSDLNALLEDLLSIPTPRRHAASLPLLQLEWRIKHCLFLRGSFPAKTVHDALSKYFACLENLFPHPHKEVSEALTTAAALCCDAHFPSVFPPQQQKELCQKAVRMHLLIHGRRMRHALLDDTTAGVLEKLPPESSTEVCAFCAESLVDAPFLPRLCSNCKQVAYCSAGCQKAHWKLHKKTCKCC